jgi:serine/threonine protein kinase
MQLTYELFVPPSLKVTYHPRVIRLQESSKPYKELKRVQIVTSRNSKFEKYPEYEVEPLSTVNVKEDKSKTALEHDDCKAMHSWQLEYKPACNPIHEINMMDNKFLAEGGFRSVWWMPDAFEDGKQGSEAVIKTLVYRKKFRDREKERHRRDATAYMMLEGSKHIPDIYGYCTNSAVFDVSREGSLADFIAGEGKGKFDISTWTPKDKLKYAWQISKAMADVHSVGNIHGSAAISHTDISPDQFLWLDGMFKLNDFNRARFILWDEKKEEACPFYIPVNQGIWRSPEEYGDDQPETEKIDIFSMGNILFALLIGEKPYKGIEKKDANELVLNGTFLKVSDERKANFTAEERAIYKAIGMCFKFDPKERKTAAEIEKYLHGKLEKYGIPEK